MVNAHFGLRDNPFRLTPDLGVRCDWPSFAAARERLRATLRVGGRAVLFGEPGVGKTLLLRSLGQELAPLGAAYVVCGRRFGPDDLARALAGAEPAILLLDDAHHMEREALADLLDGGGALALGATPGFAAPGLEEIVLPPLAPQEISDYVHCRLAAAGWSGGELFDAEACARLWRFSEGAARRINNLSSGALFLGAQQQAEKIDSGLIEAAAASLSLQPPTAPQPPAAGRRRAAAVPPPVDSPTIMAAFMRDRAGNRQPSPAIPPAPPEPAAPPAPEQSEVVQPAAPAAPPPAAAPVPAFVAPPPAAETPASLLQPAALRAPLSAPAVPRWTDEAPPPRPMRQANMALLALALLALAAVALAWRFEWLAKPDLAIDWRQVAEVTSPQQAPPPGSGPAVAVPETTPEGATNSRPIVFPNAAAQPEATAQSEGATPAAAPPTDAAERAAPAVSAAPAPEATPSPAVSLAAEPERRAPDAAAAARAPSEPAVASPQPQSPQAPPVAPPAVAAPPPADSPPPQPGREERIAELLAQARRLALAFALTTPPGQSAIDSYREVLAIAPGRPEALVGFDEIAAKYDDLAGLARLRDKPALVQLYESRAAQVRQERLRLAASPPAVERPAR